MRDKAHFQVLEAMLVTLVLLGAVFAVIQFRLPSTPRENARASIQDVATDALTVLAGLEDGNLSVLDAALAEALHCDLALDPVEEACYGARGRNLSLKLDSYLPQGAAYMIGIGNGAAIRELWRSSAPMGEAVDTRVPLSPAWGVGFIAAELSCQDAGTAANVTIVPIQQGNLTRVTTIRANMSDGTNVSAQAAWRYGIWNATLPAATRPDAGVLRADVVARGGEALGWTTHEACDLGGKTDVLLTAARETRFAIRGPTGDERAPVTSTVTFETTSPGLAALPGAEVRERTITVFAPIPPRGIEPDSFTPEAFLEVPSGESSVSWTIPAHALYGAHPVLLEQTVRYTFSTAPPQDVKVRTVGVLEIALPTGEVPLGAPYAAVLQVWFPDWS